MTNSWQGKLVRLRAIEPSDADTLFEWNQDTEMTRSLYRVPFPQSRESNMRWVQETSARGPQNDSYFWVIETLPGQMVGTLSTHSTEQRNGTFKYGLAIMEAHKRKGYASEAIRLLLRYYFDELRYQKVVAEVYAFNETSISFHENFGFVLEGRLRRMIYTNGTHHDMLMFGMTNDEFTTAHGATMDE
jgi:RimJ/RimL family protein N-acetyltransferase